MSICIVCDGNGFTLYNGLCNECNGTGESDFNYDAIIFEDGTEDIPTNELLELELFPQYEYSINLRQAIEQRFASARGAIYAKESETS